jgi:hypothetical protein
VGVGLWCLEFVTEAVGDDFWKAGIARRADLREIGGLANRLTFAMDVSLTTPALLFPAISLLLLAYTNRFLALTSVTRNLHDSYRASHDTVYLAQIRNLRKRIRLIRDMQFFGVLSILLCTVCMLLVYVGWQVPGRWVFAGSLVSMMVSLGLSLWEVMLSGRALDLHLEDLEAEKKPASE